MRFNLQIIAYKLGKKITELYMSYSDRTLLSARLLSPAAAPFDKSAVYIGQAEEVLAWPDTGLPENLIVAGSADRDTLTGKGACNMMFVAEDSPVAIHDEVQRIFDTYNDIDADLINAILCENELQSILDICTRFFSNPVYIIDSAHRMIAYSSDFSDPEWTDPNATGYLSLDVINLLKQLDILGHQAELIKTGTIPPFLSVSISDADGKIGVIGVRQTQSELSENQLSLLEHVAERLTNAVSRVHYARYVKSSQASRFMLDMLGGASCEVSFIIHNLSQLSWKIDDEYYILKILPDPKDIEGNTVKYSGELIKNMFAGSVLLEMDSELALVVNTRFCEDTLDESFLKLEDFLSSRNFTGGVSTLFSDFSWLYDQYDLAYAAIRIGSLIDRERKLFRYDKYVMPHMISLCDQVFNVSMLCHREAIKLQEYDKVNGNNYFYCLYTYLLNERSLLATSKLLNIHRSTLIYRLNKISEIIHINLDDQDTRMHMIYSYNILHFLNCLRSASSPDTQPLEK